MMSPRRQAFALHKPTEDQTRRCELENLRLADVARYRQRQREKLERIRAIRDAEGASPGLFAYALAIGLAANDLHSLGLHGFGERP